MHAIEPLDKNGTFFVEIVSDTATIGEFMAELQPFSFAQRLETLRRRKKLHAIFKLFIRITMRIVGIFYYVLPRSSYNTDLAEVQPTKQFASYDPNRPNNELTQAERLFLMLWPRVQPKISITTYATAISYALTCCANCNKKIKRLPSNTTRRFGDSKI